VDSTIRFARDLPSATAADRVRRGTLGRLAPGVYTDDVAADPAAVVKREWHNIVGGLLPGAVVTDRSAQTSGPVNGHLYLAHPARERAIALPGLTVLARRGVGPLTGDIPLPGGLFLASKGRALAENARPTRARAGREPRGLTTTELADWVDRLCRLDGPDRLLRYRGDAETFAPTLALSAAALGRLGQLIGAALGTQNDVSNSPALAARRGGNPYDPDRVRRFSLLADALKLAAPQNIPVDESRSRYRYLPFYEAYFSNYIEGTEFELDEAIRLVYDGLIPARRTQDAHDLLGTYRVVSDHLEMADTATTATDYVRLIKHRHAEIMAGRPEMAPGQFKDTANQAGNTLFVLPGLVAGTLRAGFDRVAELDTAWERAVYAMFLVAEVHPFTDGNGRLARVMMNSELVAGRQSRIIIPTVFRDDYLGSLRRLSRADDPSAVIKALRLGQEYAARIDFDTLEGAKRQLVVTNAFWPADADHRLVVPAGHQPAL